MLLHPLQSFHHMGYSENILRGLRSICDTQGRAATYTHTELTFSLCFGGQTHILGHQGTQTLVVYHSTNTQNKPCVNTSSGSLLISKLGTAFLKVFL